MFTVLFWRDAGERCIATAAEGLLAAGVAGGFAHIDWKVQAGIIGGATLGSLLKAIITANGAQRGTTSLDPGVGKHEAS